MTVKDVVTNLAPRTRAVVCVGNEDICYVDDEVRMCAFGDCLVECLATVEGEDCIRINAKFELLREGARI